jgi:hypothetical protein
VGVRAVPRKASAAPGARLKRGETHPISGCFTGAIDLDIAPLHGQIHFQ